MAPPAAVDQPATRKWMPRTPAQWGVAYTVAVVVVAFVVNFILSKLTVDAPGSCQTEEIFSCMSANRLMLTFAPTAIVGVGALAAFVKTLRVWRAHGPWMVWHASGWFLFVMMILFVGTSGGALIGQV